MSAQLATAYVNIVGSSRGLGSNIIRDLGAAGDAGGAAAGSRASKSMTDKLGGLLKKGAMGVGLAAGGVLAASLVKGWGRLTNIENATAKLSGLGHSAAGVKTIMNDALVSVKGTAFGLDAAAKVAAGAVAAGVKPGKELQRTLKLVGDAATISGGSMGDMGAIFNKVAASGKLQGDVIAQLNDAGIPILALLGKTMGKTSAEVVDMASKGKINFEMFQKAMESGLGGAALKSGETTKGALANMNAAFGRFGANLLQGVFPMAKVFFGAVNKGVDNLNTAITPFVKSFSEKMGSAFTYGGKVAKDWAKQAGQALDSLKKSDGFKAFKDNVQAAFGTSANPVDGWGQKVYDASGEAMNKAAGLWKEFGPKIMPALEGAVGKLMPIWNKLADTASRSMKPLGQIISAVALALSDATKTIGISSWQVFLAVADTVASLLQSYLVPALQGVADWMGRNRNLVAAIAVGFVAYRLAMTGVAVATNIAAAATKAWAAGQAILNAVMSANPVAIVIVAVAALAAGFIYLWKNSEGFRDFFIGMWASIKTAAAGVVDWFKGAWVFITDYLINPVKAAWDWIYAAFAAAVSWATGAVAAIGTALSTGWSFVTDYLINPVRAAWDWITTRFKDATTWAGAVVTALVAVVKTAWDSVQERLIAPVRAAWDWIYAKLSAAVGLVSSGIRVIASGLAIAWKVVYDSIIKPISDGWIWVTTKLGQVAGWIGRKLSDIVSALSGAWKAVTEAVKTPVLAGWNWVSTKLVEVAGWVGSKIGQVASNLSSGWSKVTEAIKAPILAGWNWVSTKFVEVSGWIGGMISSIAGTVSGAWDSVTSAITAPVQAAWDWVIGKLEAIKGAVQGAVSWISDKLSAISMPSFGSFGGGALGQHAKGGNLDRGWNVVGEEGPELVYGSGAGAKVYPTKQTLQMLAPVSSTGGSQTLSGNLYLDSGELLGVVHGVVQADKARDNRALAGSR